MIASGNSDFRGLMGIEEFAQEFRPEQPIEKIKPKPDTWVQSAVSKWVEGKH